MQETQNVAAILTLNLPIFAAAFLIDESYLAPRLESLLLLKRGGSSSYIKRLWRDMGRTQAEALGYGRGTGRALEKLRRDVHLLKTSSKWLGRVAGPVGAGLTVTGEFQDNEEYGATERAVRTGISTTSRVGFGTAGATILGGLCAPAGALAIGCGAAGAVGGDYVGRGVGHIANFAIFELSERLW